MEIKKGIYRHYKGKNYEVLGIGRHSETLEEFVVYRALYENEFGFGCIWIRPLKMFSEEVEFEGRKVKRFSLISESVSS